METETPRRARPGRVLKYVLLGVLLCAAVGAGCFVLGRTAASRQTASLDAVVLQNRLSSISELASVEYHYTNMGQFESSSDFYGVKIPFTTKSFILTYDGTIKAGVDLSAASVSVSGTEVRVRLPAAKILSHEIDEDSVKVFDEKSSLFNPFTVEDFTAFQSDQKKEMERKAEDQSLLTTAQEKAEDAVRSLLTPSLPDGWTLSVTSAAL